MDKEVLGAFELPDSGNFVQTEHVNGIIQRALLYLRAGFPVHLSGPSGTGKTSIAMHLARLIGRPAILIHGDDEFSSSDLVGGNYGYRRKRTIDNYIHSIHRLEENWEKQWSDGRITKACREGLTLIYDEFTRSRPEANNELLSILEEKILDLPNYLQGKQYLKVHPDFAAIFTSNPEEYVGVYKTQDALKDRMITIELEPYDLETEIAITAKKSGLSLEEAEKIVHLVRAVRERGKNSFAPSIRCCIMIAKIVCTNGGRIDRNDDFFRQTCLDILTAPTNELIRKKRDGDVREFLESLIHQYCGVE